MRHLYRLPAALAVFAPLPALAHLGDHSGFDLAGLGLHFIEADHLIFLALIGLTGWLAYRAGRRAEARALKQERDHDPR